MELTRIDRDCNAVRVLAAQARGERVDSGVRENLDNLTKDLASDFNPQNRHIIAQLVGFAVNEMTRPQMNLMQLIGDAQAGAPWALRLLSRCRPKACRRSSRPRVPLRPGARWPLSRLPWTR